MHLNLKHKNEQGLTVVEFIFVLCILFVLFKLLLPFGGSHKTARIAQAKTEMQGLIAAINQYQTVYSKMPFQISSTNSTSYFTFGTFGTCVAPLGITNVSGDQVNNSELMAVLMDVGKFENGKATSNTNHALNPQRTVFINIKQAKDTNSHGLGPDGVYRDPWGNPYIITINSKGDGKCRDAFYRLASVSEANSGQVGLNGLVRATPPPYTSQNARDSFELATNVMVWSLGPDGKADPSQKADQGVNKDNILSW